MTHPQINSFRDPAISPEGPTSGRELSNEDVDKNRQLVKRWADELYNASAEEIFQWARDYAPRPLVITMSMENTVLAELANDHLPGTDLLFLDTEYHFDETLRIADEVEQRYPNLPLIRAKATLTREQQDQVYGPALYLRDPGACCRMRKVEPLQRHLGDYVGTIDGLRRADGPTRANAPALSLSATGRLKISPLITWSLDQTDDYSTRRNLIIHPLTTKGYPSIGCATCTQKVAPGEDPRAGRWAFSDKTECGLHTQKEAE